jgi:hypothetical protein
LCHNSSKINECQFLTQGTYCIGPEPFKCRCNESQFFNFINNKCENLLELNETCLQIDSCKFGECRKTMRCECLPQQIFNSTTHECENVPCKQSTEMTMGIILKSTILTTTFSSETTINRQLISIVTSTIAISTANLKSTPSTIDIILERSMLTTKFLTLIETTIISEQVFKSKLTTVVLTTISVTTKCVLRKYFNNKDQKCQDQLLGGKKCMQSDACRSDLGLSCQSEECKCSVIQYWNDKDCIPMLLHNDGDCREDSHCKGELICKTSGGSIKYCDCPVRNGIVLNWNGINCV